ncbi:MAG: chemotaxis protein CheC [Candidatus Lokiarchaeia archaeon]
MNNLINLKLTQDQLDMLKELGNIGSGHAITALSELLNNKIEVSLTTADIMPFWKVPELFDNPNMEMVGIYSDIPSKTDLAIIQIFTKESIINLINILTNHDKISSKDLKIIDDLDDFSCSIINEIGNILSGHYANAIADLLSIKLMPNVPKIAFDSLTAILEGVIAKYSQISDYMVIINTKLTVSDIKLEGTICLIPSISILKSLFDILNVKYELNL